MAEWISVKDRVPDTGTPVLAYNNMGHAIASYFPDSMRWINREGSASRNWFDYWMPLPDPPEEPCST